MYKPVIVSSRAEALFGQVTRLTTTIATAGRHNEYVEAEMNRKLRRMTNLHAVAHAYIY